MKWLNRRLSFLNYFLLIMITTTYISCVCGETICHPKDFCTCEMSDGSGTVSLHPISSNTNTPWFKNIPDVESTRKFTYNFNPCKTFSMGNCKDVLLCQVYASVSSPMYYDIGSSMSTQYNAKSKQLTYVYPSSHQSTKKKITYIDLVCDEKADKPILSKFKESPPDTYRSTLTSKYACVKKSQSRKKLSIGTILCILLLVIFVLYLSLGIVFNKYQRQKEGSELIPNVGFWKDLPSLVKI